MAKAKRARKAKVEEIDPRQMNFMHLLVPEEFPAPEGVVVLETGAEVAIETVPAMEEVVEMPATIDTIEPEVEEEVSPEAGQMISLKEIEGFDELLDDEDDDWDLEETGEVIHFPAQEALLPKKVLFQQIFDKEVAFGQQGAPASRQWKTISPIDKKEVTLEVGPYCRIQGGGKSFPSHLYVNLTDEAFEAITGNMIPMPNESIDFIIVIKEGEIKASIYARYSQISNPRKVAEISVGTIPKNPNSNTSGFANAPRIPEWMLAFLSAATVSGNRLIAPFSSLEPQDFQMMNRLVKELGGKFVKDKDAYIFDEHSPEKVLETLFLTLNGDKLLQGRLLLTEQIAQETVDLSGLQPGMLPLVPCAHTGELAEQVAKVVDKEDLETTEVDGDCIEVLRQKKFNVDRIDFLDVDPDSDYDRIVMAPPYFGQAYIDYVRHAFEFLRPGGRMVAIVPAAFTFCQDELSLDFRKWVSQYGWFTPNHEERFRDSYATIYTVTLVLEKPSIFN